MDGARRDELVLQALETELCGVRVYQTALRCARNESLREEWMRYLEQTEHHARIVRDLCSALGLDPEIETAGRRGAP
jgi:rubrerythrin